MKKLVILIMMIILIGCGGKEVTEKNVKNLTEGEKQTLLLINRVTSKEPNIFTIKDILIINSLIVELYGKGALKNGTKEDLELIGLTRLVKASGKSETDGFDEIFKKEIKLAKSLKVPEIYSYITDDYYLVSEYENIKIKQRVFKDENGSFQLADGIEYYYNDKSVTITQEQEKLAIELLEYNTNFSSYIEGREEHIYLSEDENGNTIALKKEEDINGDITKQILYNYLGEKYIEAEYFKNNLLVKAKVYNLSGETTIDFEIKKVNGQNEPTFKFFKDGNKIIEFEGDNIIRSFDSEGNIKGTIDLDTGMLDEIDGSYKVKGRNQSGNEKEIYVLDISKLLKIKTLKDVYTNLTVGLKVVTEYENDKVIKKEIWKDFGKHGESKEWYLNGQLKSIKRYFNNNLVDTSMEYDETGKLKEKIWYDMASLAYITEYDKKGKITKKYGVELKDEKRILADYYREYHPNGAIKIDGRHANGLKHRDWKYYDSEGNLRKRALYNNGKFIEATEYNEKGTTTKYTKVLEDGINKYVVEYSNRGYVAKEYYLDKNDNFIWEYREYGDDNKYNHRYLKLKGKYNNGVKEGEWKKYDATGSLIETIIYVDGKDINDMVDEIDEQEKWNTPKVEYYPSGRVKSYSDGPFEATYEDKDINFVELENFVKNMEKEVEEYIKTKDEEIGYSISMSLNEGIGSDISIYSLNKNLTSEEKKKLQELQARINKCHEKASQIWGAQ